MKRLISWLFAAAVLAGVGIAYRSGPVFGKDKSADAAGATTKSAKDKSSEKQKDVGEQVPSEDPMIKDMHSLGLIDGRVDIFRSASPSRDLVKGKEALADAAAQGAEENKRMKHLYDLGIRTIISLENPDSKTDDGESAASGEQRAAWINLEKTAAGAAGITFVSRPVNNSGKDSLETMSDADVEKELDGLSTEVLSDAQKGGVLFHCAAGHDRTGILAAYIRIKIEKWPVDQAIEEMRRLGHNWVKYSNNGGESSWHEGHLKAIAADLKAESSH